VKLVLQTPVANNVIPAKAGVQPFPFNSILASPSNFLCFAKESYQRKATLRCRFWRVAPELPCDARSLRRLRNSPVLRRAQTVLADTPSDRCASRQAQRGRSTAKHRFAFACVVLPELPYANKELTFWYTRGFPFGGAEKRKSPRSFPRGLSEPRAKAKTASSAGHAYGGAGSGRNAPGCDPGAGHMCALVPRDHVRLRGRIPLRGSPAPRSGAPEGSEYRREVLAQ